MAMNSSKKGERKVESNPFAHNNCHISMFANKIWFWIKSVIWWHWRGIDFSVRFKQSTNDCGLIYYTTHWPLYQASQHPSTPDKYIFPIEVDAMIWLENHSKEPDHKDDHSLPALVSPIPSACNSIAVGIPTFFDLPQTTAFFPKVSIPKKETNSLMLTEYYQREGKVHLCELCYDQHVSKYLE